MPGARSSLPEMLLSQDFHTLSSSFWNTLKDFIFIPITFLLDVFWSHWTSRIAFWILIFLFNVLASLPHSCQSMF